MLGHRFTRSCVFVLALSVLGCGGGGSSGSAPLVPPSGGTVAVGLDVEPGCLNVYLPCGNFFSTSVVVNNVLAGAFRIRPDYTFEPVLVESVTVEEAPFRLTYRIGQNAVWSDGTPVSADDFIFTFETVVNPANNVITRQGFELIVSATKLDEKTVRFEFSTPFAGWRTLFGNVLPRHALIGEDFNNVFLTNLNNPKTGQPIGSGPFLLTGRVAGESITLSRNPRYLGGGIQPFLDSIVFRFKPIADQFADIRSGALDVILPQASPLLVDLVNEGRTDIVIVQDPSRNIEHIDLQNTSTTQPLLQQAWFRQAIAYSLDRVAVAAAVFGTLSPGLPVSDSLFYNNAQPEYVPSFETYRYSPQTVADLMTRNGCVLGTDGIWTCNGTRASLRFATTAGNTLRELAQTLFKSQAAAAGIELVVDNSPGGTLFGTRLPAGDFDAVMFTWVKSGQISGEGELYACGGDLNFMNYCNPQVDPLLSGADSEVGLVAQAALVNDANDVIAGDAPTLPLFFRPSFLAYRNPIGGVINNPSSQGPLWNVEDWFTTGPR